MRAPFSVGYGENNNLFAVQLEIIECLSVLGVKSCLMIFADQGVAACHPTFRHGREQAWLRTRGS